MSDGNSFNNPTLNDPGPERVDVASYFEIVHHMIPDMDTAVADYNGVPFSHPPFRDTPSAILGILFRPDLSKPEPTWNTLLHYFLTPSAKHGFSNLQDLFLFIIRVAIPNAVIYNRIRMIDFFNEFPQAPATIQFRYDGWDDTQQARIDPQKTQVTVPPRSMGDPRPNLPLNYSAHILERAIFRNRVTPSGVQFLEWLSIPIGPAQTKHRPGEIDNYLRFSESAVRGWIMEELMRHTIRVLGIFWWISHSNEKFRKLHTNV